MQIGHQLVDVAVRGDETLIHVARVRGRVTNAVKAIDRRKFGNEFAEAPRAPLADPVIGVDVLTEQRDLSRAGVDQTLRLLEDVGDGTRIFGAARIGHHAESAEAVAPFLDGEERGGFL